MFDNLTAPKRIAKKVVAPREDGIGTDKRHVIMFVDHYGSQLSYFVAMALEARKDFPSLDINEITVEHLGGDRYPSRYYSIEFLVDPSEPALESYEVIRHAYVTK